jgi:hypothetical protein
MSPKDTADKTALAAAAPTPEQAYLAIMNGQAQETGFEESTAADFVMPMLKILNDLSPEMKATNAKYRPGAKLGQFMDTSSGEIFDGPFFMIPCLYQSKMVEWKANRGGFVATHESDFGGGLPVNDKGKKIMPNGNEVIDTRYYYCLRVKGEELVPNIISLSSTAIKISKELYSKLDSQRVTRKDQTGTFKPPMWANVVKVSSVLTHKDTNDWFAWKFDLDHLISEKEAAMLMKAQQARTVFQESSSRMKPVQESDGGAPDANPHL